MMMMIMVMMMSKMIMMMMMSKMIMMMMMMLMMMLMMTMMMIRTRRNLADSGGVPTIPLVAVWRLVKYSSINDNHNQVMP